MNLITILTMLIVPGIIWGGFIIFLSLAIHKENQKEKNG
jgi:hypothetical protein